MDDDTFLKDLIPQKTEQRDENVGTCNRQTGFVVVHNNARCKRLHKIDGGCWMAKSKLFKVSDEYLEMPDESKYTHVCKVCCRKTKDEFESSEDDSTSSSSSAESTGSEQI